ncbi:hypothetical protein M0R45_009839 [Rubus argutus]|uniref:Uncharacterized protein n=1 Tax=Rubus argutus TaxID=59490 RepID=A0AAW1Y863_RUBAR
MAEGTNCITSQIGKRPREEKRRPAARDGLAANTVDWAIGSNVEDQQRRARQQWIGEGAELLHGLMEKRSGGGDDVMAGQIWFWVHGGAGKEIYGGGEEVRDGLDVAEKKSMG